jgi:antibiotic biosynthesis monooxygenase (ABM) superfamily enzyme
MTATWLALFPVVIAVSSVLHAVELAGVRLPLVGRCLVTTVIVVPTMSWCTLPLMRRVLAGWLSGPPVSCQRGVADG